MMTPSAIQRTLDLIGGKINKRLGQHFLTDDQVLHVIVEAAQLQKGENVLEIGPGLGVLTEALLKAGTRVTAIERDQRFIEYLQGRFASADLSLIKGDAACLAWSMSDRWKLVSNLPYQITSLALRKALWGDIPAERVVVLVQREVAERAISVASGVTDKSKGKTSLLSLMVAFASVEATIVRHVPAKAFYPPPKVESSILAISVMTHKMRREKWGIDPEQVMMVAKQGFSHPRMNLASNLHLKNDRLHIFADVELDMRARAEELSVSQWVELAKIISAAKGDQAAASF